MFLVFQLHLMLSNITTVEQNRHVQTMSLTSPCWVHSNVYALRIIQWIWYFTAVDSIHSTSSALQMYHGLTSVSVEILLCTYRCNSTSIGEVPVPYGGPSSATVCLVSYTEQGIITFTNLFQGHNTVVVICCAIEWKTDIIPTWEEIQLFWCLYIQCFGEYNPHTCAW